MPKWTDKVQAADFEQIAKRALTKIGAMLEDAAVALCPVRTGRLRGSITYAVQDYQDGVRSEARQSDAVSRPRSSYICHVGTNVEYAPYVEYGTIYHGAQPYLRPAMDRGRKTAQQIFRDEMKGHLRGQ